MTAYSPAVYRQIEMFGKDLPDHDAQVRTYTAAGLNDITARSLEDRAAKIITLGRRAILEIGNELLLARRDAAHGTWGAFLARCGLAERTAQNYISVAEKFGERPDVLRLLPPTALYALAAESADPAAVEAVIAEAQAGNAPTVAEVQQRVRPTPQPVSPPKAVTPAPMPTPAPVPVRPAPIADAPEEEEIAAAAMPAAAIPPALTPLPPTPAPVPPALTPLTPAAPRNDLEWKRIAMLHAILTEALTIASEQLRQLPDDSPIYDCDTRLVRSAAANVINHQAVQAQAYFLAGAAVERQIIEV